MRELKWNSDLNNIAFFILRGILLSMRMAWEISVQVKMHVQADMGVQAKMQ
jgi:hypothetical protein